MGQLVPGAGLRFKAIQAAEASEIAAGQWRAIMSAHAAMEGGA
jgi:hypothetical protein